MGRTGRSSGSSGRSFSGGSGRSFSGGMKSPSSSRTRSSGSNSSKSFSPSRPPSRPPSTPSYRPNTTSRPKINSPTFVNIGGFNRGTNGSSGGSSYIPPNRGNSGGLGKLLISIGLIMLIVLAVVNLLASSDQSNATLIERTPLPLEYSTETNYYTDTLNWINSANKLEEGMKHFYRETGVQPHLYIVDNIEGDSNPDNPKVEKWMSEKYDELFTDEAHLLTLILDNGTNYGTWVLGGNQTKTVIDGEARDILLNYVDKYYTSSMDEDEMFSKVFKDTADSIMYVYENSFAKVAKLLLILIIIVIVGIIVVKLITLAIKANQKKREQELEILNQSIDKIEDIDISDITDKYK